jgi:hypothetical protein
MLVIFITGCVNSDSSNFIDIKSSEITNLTCQKSNNTLNNSKIYDGGSSSMAEYRTVDPMVRVRFPPTALSNNKNTAGMPTEKIECSGCIHCCAEKLRT